MGDVKITYKNMNYELAKKLKDEGFPQATLKGIPLVAMDGMYYPTLSELIRACGDKFYGLHRTVNNEWVAFIYDIEDSTRQLETKGQTPEEAVANLWLKLNR